MDFCFSLENGIRSDFCFRLGHFYSPSIPLPRSDSNLIAPLRGLHTAYSLTHCCPFQFYILVNVIYITFNLHDFKFKSKWHSNFRFNLFKFRQVHASSPKTLQKYVNKVLCHQRLYADCSKLFHLKT